jgi:AcrR family transcriptional regulator
MYRSIWTLSTLSYTAFPMTTPTDRYHHGDLPNALRRAAVEVIDERGLGDFSLREVARRAGVSHTAPAHHFGDVRGLLTSVAAEGFQTLQQVTEAAAARHDAPVDKLRAIGEAYVSLARSHKGHCAVMFRPDVVDVDDPSLQHCGLDAYAVLEGVISGVLTQVHSDVDLDVATWMCWSTMQGLVELGPKFDVINLVRGREPISTTELVDQFTDLIVRSLRRPATGTTATSPSPAPPPAERPTR